ncbi:MAG: hypothetical protein ACJ8FT_02155 [Sphingomonas sp.]
MRKAVGFVLAGTAAAALAAGAVAASRNTHVMNVALPDGSTARVEYVGDVAPKVTVVPGQVQADPFALFDRSAFDMQRQIDAMMRQVSEMARQPLAGAPGLNVAAYGNAPAGATSVTVVSTSNGARTCTRTTEVTAQGPGKPPKVVSNLSGDCGAAAAAVPQRPTA